MAELTPSTRAFINASRTNGLAAVEDFNCDVADGVGPYPLNVVDNVRMNTGMTYLTDSVRSRPNLSIRGDAEVDRLVIEGNRVVGLRLISGEILSGGEVILSAGVFGSPAILMRSGIGPAAHLRDLNIPVVVDLPVGTRLQDHPFYFNVYALKAAHKAMLPAAGALVWTGSKSANPGDLDLQISATHFFDPQHSPTGGAIVLASALVLPRSIGLFQLASRDPRVAPRIQYNFLDDPIDMERMIEVIRLTRAIAESEPLVEMIDSEIFPNQAVEDDQLQDHIRSNISTYSHPTSTVPMGRDDDTEAVVDSWGKVRGVLGLRVVAIAEQRI